MQADLLIINCRIYTLSDRQLIADSMAIIGDRVAAVGPGSEGLKGPRTRVIDLDGLTVVPGFIDSHNHLVDYGIAKLRSANLLGSRSIAEIIQRLKEHHENLGSGQWVLGHCFDQELLTEERFPTKDELDRSFGSTPVLITRVCGHACVVNSAVLEEIGDNLSDFSRNTGLLTESRAGLAWSKIPVPTGAQIKQAAKLAGEEARSKGITGVHCLVGGVDEFTALQKLHEQHALPIRIYAHLPLGLHEDAVTQGFTTGSGDDWLRIGAVKIFMDGSMGARTAAMHEDFTDDPGNTGELLLSSDELSAIVSKLQEDDFQAAVHAIGDLAVDEAVLGFEKALDGRDNRVHRHRIEHASIMTDLSLEKMASLRIIAAVQPQFVVSDFWTIDRVGPERYRYAYPFKTMLDRGITLAMGSDCPVEIMDPFQLIYRAVTRDPISRNESISPMDAVTGYCLGSAYAAFEEGIKGSLEPGKLADFAVLSKDIFAVDPDEIESITAVSTCVGGCFYPEL